MMRIGPWLKNKRKEAGKSQLETAMETYVSIDTIRKIEQDTIYPRTNHFEKLCDFFGVNPVDYYLTSLEEDDPRHAHTLNRHSPQKDPT